MKSGLRKLCIVLFVVALLFVALVTISTITTIVNGGHKLTDKTSSISNQVESSNQIESKARATSFSISKTASGAEVALNYCIFASFALYILYLSYKSLLCPLKKSSDNQKRVSKIGKRKNLRQ